MGFLPRCPPSVKGSRFARNVTRLASANLLAQSLLLASAPLLTRIYTPADFGALGVFMAITSIGLAFGTARFEWSMPNPRSATQAGALLLFGMATLALTCICVLAVLLAARLGGLPAAWARSDGVWWLLPARARRQRPATTAGRHVHVRGAELRSMSRVTLLQSCSHLLTVLGIGWLFGAAAGVWGLTSRRAGRGLRRGRRACGFRRAGCAGYSSG